MVTNVYAKSSYDHLRINKALGILKTDNNNNKLHSDLGPSRSKKTQ